MSYKSYSKISKTLDVFQRESIKDPKQTDIEDNDTQSPSKSMNIGYDQKLQKPILKPRSIRRKPKKSQISEENPMKKTTRFKKPLKEVYTVESYKEYNSDISEEGTSWFCGFSCFFVKKSDKNI